MFWFWSHLLGTFQKFEVIFIHFVKVELIGYAASHDELFLVYEYAQKGSFRNHLHDPQNKGKIMHLCFGVWNSNHPYMSGPGT